MHPMRFLIIGLAALLLGCSKSESPRVQIQDEFRTTHKVAGPVQPIPEFTALNTDKVQMGKLLFHDRRLSKDNSISCAFCHPLDHYGADGLAVSTGIDKKQGDHNAPTVYNAALNFRQFWDGRAASLEEQAGGPVENPLEMGSTWALVLNKLGQDEQLQSLSQRVYGQPLSEATIRDAIATFERTLTTPNSPFDRYLKGDQNALSAQQKQGWQLFRDLGCVSCHQGANLGGNMYATLGVMEDYFAGRPLSSADLGLFNRTGREEDKHKFKVPGLRNVEKTAPYFHDGQVETLDKAVYLMARTELGITLSSHELASLVAFLKSLTATTPPIKP